MANAAALFVFGKSPGAVKDDKRFNMGDAEDIKLYDKVIAPHHHAEPIDGHHGAVLGGVGGKRRVGRAG
jgi:hypothetical protein